jgi:hypothetical protein
MAQLIHPGGHGLGHDGLRGFERQVERGVARIEGEQHELRRERRHHRILAQQRLTIEAVGRSMHRHRQATAQPGNSDCRHEMVDRVGGENGEAARGKPCRHRPRRRCGLSQAISGQFVQPPDDREVVPKTGKMHGLRQTVRRAVYPLGGGNRRGKIRMSRQPGELFHAHLRTGSRGIRLARRRRSA